ncbi:sigma-70 family RNA polymerase sigma factor [Hymenobacter sp. GOD-10R]|uniref:RNA polymerase sigma factor n=1 Tax=Hymenobacter sp. GOD-10R TaxID=3093922 RepID=UPI002D766A3C|nr:sigma-70 family RNA polymerase sigma factor [Hymenobacter sp. GOD-10R]WRQ29339.1 sigma-70 family RNA polymerase sigma factor [Hymenobacter sp. GOD-10R]
MYTPPPAHHEQRHGEDLALWQAFRAGQREALGVLFDRYAQQLFAYGHHLVSDAEQVKDAIQTVFVNLWVWRENVSEEVTVKFYLYRSLKRELLKRTNEPRLRLAHPPTEEQEPSIEQQWVTTEDEQQVAAKLNLSLAQLSGREKEIINLKYFNNFKIREIADLLHLSEQTVSNLLHRALQKLRKSVVLGFLLFLVLGSAE